MATLKELQEQINLLKAQNDLIIEKLAEHEIVNERNIITIDDNVAPIPSIKKTASMQADVGSANVVGTKPKTSGWLTVLLIIGIVMTLSFSLYSVPGIIIILTYLYLMDNQKSNIKNVKQGKVKNNKVKNIATTKSGLEEKIGIKWFSWLGVLAIVIGLGFFIKYAVDNHWLYIDELWRIILVVTAGLGMTIFGQFVSKKERYLIWGRTLTGGGLAIMYFAIYAAYNLPVYRQAIGISLLTDIFLLSLVAGLTLYYAVRDDSQIIAGEALAFGFITSRLGADFTSLTLYYNLFLAIVVVATAAWRKWPMIGFLNVIGTYIMFFWWYSGNQIDARIAFVFLSIYFVLYTILAFYFKNQAEKAKVKNAIISLDNEPETYSLAITVVNGIVYFLLGFNIITNFNVVRDFDGLFSFLLSIYYFGVMAIAYASKKIKLLTTAFYLAMLFLVLAIPLQFSRDWVTVIWSLLALVLSLLWFKYQTKALKVTSLILWTATVVKALTFDMMTLRSFDFANIINSTRFFVTLVTIACLAISYLALQKVLVKMNETEKNSLPYFYSGLATLLTLVILFVEFNQYSFWVIVVLGLLGLKLLMISSFSKLKELSWWGHCISLLVIMKMLMTWLGGHNNGHYGYFVVGILFFYLLAIFFKTFKVRLSIDDLKVTAFYSWVGSGLLTIYVWLNFASNMVSIYWAITALIILTIGFVSKQHNLRYQGLLLFGITILKVFLFDTRALSTIYRTLSFMALGIILLGVSFVYAKYKEKIKEIL